MCTLKKYREYDPYVLKTVHGDIYTLDEYRKLIEDTALANEEKGRLNRKIWDLEEQVRQLKNKLLKALDGPTEDDNEEAE